VGHLHERSNRPRVRRIQNPNRNTTLGISRYACGSSPLEVSFHRHEMELRRSNFHFIATKWKFVARTHDRFRPSGPIERFRVRSALGGFRCGGFRP
jgi:hypothetical protein